MIGDGFRIEGGGLDHDQQGVVAADEVAQILTRLNGGIVATDEEQKQLTQLVKLARLSGKKRLMKLACLLTTPDKLSSSLFYLYHSSPTFQLRLLAPQGVGSHLGHPKLLTFPPKGGAVVTHRQEFH
jgi:hypothetical protein